MIAQHCAKNCDKGRIRQNSYVFLVSLVSLFAYNEI